MSLCMCGRMRASSELIVTQMILMVMVVVECLTRVRYFSMHALIRLHTCPKRFHNLELPL
jgi:hypothetical protein